MYLLPTVVHARMAHDSKSADLLLLCHFRAKLRNWQIYKDMKLTYVVTI